MASENTFLNYEAFLKIKNRKSLEEAYRDQGFQGSRSQLIRKAQQEWKVLCMRRAEERAKEPEEFLPEVFSEGSRSYQIYGVIHGLAGGDDARYKAFISRKIETLDLILFENALNYFYAHKAHVIIPDFILFGIWGSFKIGFCVGLQFPFLFFLLLKEIIKPKKSEKKPAFMTCDPLYHGVDSETRRGLDDYPALPSELQIDLELEDWEQGRSKASEGYVVPRSLFMAAFAQAYAVSRDKKEVHLVVGDLHTLEILRFLEKTPEKHPVYQKAYRIGSLSDRALRLVFIGEKIKHLFASGMGGVLGLAPYLVILLLILWYFQAPV
jgi:hypothetical protein